MEVDTHETDEGLPVRTNRDRLHSAPIGSGRPSHVERLGEKIHELLVFIQKKTNVHGDIRRLAGSISTAYNLALRDLSTTLEKPMEQVATTTQTSPGMATTAPPCTPIPSKVVKDPKKRQLSSPSPILSTERQTKKPTQEGDWKLVDRKKKKAPEPRENGAQKRTAKASQEGNGRKDGPVKVLQKTRRKKARTKAILIKPSAGQTYADLLKNIKGKVNPEESGANIKSIRQTKEGGVLLEISKKTNDDTAFTEAIKTAVGGCGTVKRLTPMTTIEILDLDGVSTEAEIREALTRDYKENLEIRRVNLTKVTPRGQRAAFCEIDEASAMKALEKARIKIGWVNCRIRLVARVPRCFKCLGFGHQSRYCKGPDRSKCCYKCGGENHKSADCTEQPKCFLCTSNGKDKDSVCHISGSGACNVYRAALAEATKAQK